MTEKSVVMFDGVCNLCNGIVRFIVARDRAGYFQFTALQSEAGRALQEEHGITPASDPDTFLLVENGKIYDRSSAAVRVARHLDGIWKLGFAFIIVPRFLRNIVYNFVAKRRYRWFGRKGTCMVPTPELRARFL